MKLGLFHLDSRKLREGLELQPLPVEYDLRSSKPGEDAIWFSSCSRLIRKSKQMQSYTMLFLRQSLHRAFPVPTDMLESILRKNCLTGRGSTGLELSQHASIIQDTINQFVQVPIF